MSSYADVASKGPKQSEEEVRISTLCASTRSQADTIRRSTLNTGNPSARRAADRIIHRIPPHVPEIAHEDSSVHSLNSQGSINTAPPPSFAEQQKQAEDAARNAKEEASRTATKAGDSAKDFGKKAESKAADLERDGKKAYGDFKAEAGKDLDKAKKQAGIEKEKAKKTAKKTEDWAEKNKNNPVVIGNAVVVAALSGLLGFGAYRKHAAGELTWKVAGAWAGAVGLFAVGDYYVSQLVTPAPSAFRCAIADMTSQVAVQE